MDGTPPSPSLPSPHSCFYGACDGIFLNYSWSEHQLDASKEYARHYPAIKGEAKCTLDVPFSRLLKEAVPKNEVKEGLKEVKEEKLQEELQEVLQKEVQKVYVGVDVFGRNFYEGGGFNTHKVHTLVKVHTNTSYTPYKVHTIQSTYPCMGTHPHN